MVEFKESKFYKLLQDFFINNNKETFLQMLGEFYNRTESIIDKNIIQDELIKELREFYIELRELYIEFNEKGIDENIVIEKVNYFVENNEKIKDIISKLIINTNNIKNNNSKLDKLENLSNKPNVDLMRAKRIAHRGYSALAPENSIPAYELASEYGFWGGECDISETLDNEFVLMHDDTIDRTTNGTGNVSSYTLEQLKTFNIDVGNNISSYPNLKIPTLDEFLLTCKKIDLVPVIEIKSISDSNIDKFLDKIRSYGFIDKAVIISFNYNLLVKIRNKENRVMLQPLLDLTQENIDKCLALGVNTHIDCPYSQVNKEIIELAHKKGLFVNAWTVNGENKLNELIDCGIDFITTDNLFDEETVKYKLKNNLSISANQISSIQLGTSRNKVGLTYEEIIIKSLASNRCSTVNRFYSGSNDTVVINIPAEYKVTLMPFDVNGAYLRDYGWFTNSEIDISRHTDVDHYHIYFARVDDGNLTENDISILKQKVSIFFKTKAKTTNNRKYVFLINGSPMALQGEYSTDKCTVVYDGDSTKTFTLTYDTPLSTSRPGVAFGNISLGGDLDVDIRVRGETKTGFKFAFIKKSTNTLLTEEEINRKSWFYFNLVHMG